MPLCEVVLMNSSFMIDLLNVLRPYNKQHNFKAAIYSTNFTSIKHKII